MVAKTKHNLYQTWQNMISRCYVAGASNYKNYGGRGITVCESWKNDFWQFVSDMGERPKNYSIDRIDVNGNYEPKNCKWSSISEQARNTRKARIVEIDGKKYHVAELEEKYGLNMKTIYYRVSQGLPFEKIISKEKLYNNLESQKKATLAHAEKMKNQTHCKNGHEFSEENTYIYRNSRMCRKCRKAWDKYLYYKKTRALQEFL